MTDLLTPGEVIGLVLRRRSTSRKTIEDFARLRRNYLTLWDRNKELERELLSRRGINDEASYEADCCHD